MNRSILRAVLALALAVPVLPAVDVVGPALHGMVEILPSDFSSTVEGPGGRFEASDDAPHIGGGIGVDWWFSGPEAIAGPLFGLEAAGAAASFESGEQKIVELRLLAGWAMEFAPAWSGRVGARVGYGMGRLDLEIGDGQDFAADGSGWSVEPGVELHLQASENLSLWIGGGWRAASYSYSSGEVDVELENRGLAIRLGGAWWFGGGPGQ